MIRKMSGMAIWAQFGHILFLPGFWLPVLLGCFCACIFRCRICSRGIQIHQYCGDKNRPYYSLLAGKSMELPGILRIAGEHLVLEKVVFRGIDGRNEPAEIIKVMEKPRRSLHGFSPGRIWPYYLRWSYTRCSIVRYECDNNSHIPSFCGYQNPWTGYWCGDLVKDQSLNPGTIAFWQCSRILKEDLLISVLRHFNLFLMIGSAFLLHEPWGN